MGRYKLLMIDMANRQDKERELNELAEEGYRVVNVVAASSGVYAWLMVVGKDLEELEPKWVKNLLYTLESKSLIRRIGGNVFLTDDGRDLARQVPQRTQKD
jgi:hypothetical protein